MSEGGAAPRTGPGRLVLVVGPSGAGKDTVIRRARDTLAHDADYDFPRRIVTRPPSAAEDNVQVGDEDFARMEADGDFLIAWDAHGLRYGLPTNVREAVSAGRTVVCNVSRTVIEPLRRGFSTVLVIEITAPPDVLAARLAARGRAEDGEPASRVARSRTVPDACADVKVVNNGTVEEASQAFLQALAGGTARPAAANNPPQPARKAAPGRPVDQTSSR